MKAESLYILVVSDTILFRIMAKAGPGKKLIFKEDDPAKPDLEVKADEWQEIWEVIAWVKYPPVKANTLESRITALELQFQELSSLVKKSGK